MYVATETIHYHDPEMQYLDTADNTVCGLFNTRIAGINHIHRIAGNRFGMYLERMNETVDGITLDIPDYLHAEWHVFEYVTERVRPLDSKLRAHRV